MTTLITGMAGFIGMHSAERLLARGERVVGIDNINDYYDPSLKNARIARLVGMFGNLLNFFQTDFSDMAALDDISARFDFDKIIHLGAQAGVRYSIENPHAYVPANLAGHLNMLELARRRGRSRTWSMPLPPRSTAATQLCRSASRIASIIRCRSTPPPRRRTS